MPKQLEVDFGDQVSTGLDKENFMLFDKGAAREETIQQIVASQAEVDHQSRAHGFKWPSNVESKKTSEKSDNKRSPYQVRMRGKEVPLSEAARLRNRPYNVVLERFKRGERGAKLFRPVRPYRVDSREDADYIFYLGISEEKWFEIIDYAKARGMREAAIDYDVPKEAVEAALNGEMERLD